MAAEQKKIEREYERLRQCYSKFKTLRQAMAELVAKAVTDPVAAKKLNDVKALMPGGISGLEREAAKDMQAIRATLKQLQARLKNIANSK